MNGRLIRTVGSLLRTFTISEILDALAELYRSNETASILREAARKVREDVR
jgi:hypothetical protein